MLLKFLVGTIRKPRAPEGLSRNSKAVYKNKVNINIVQILSRKEHINEIQKGQNSYNPFGYCVIVGSSADNGLIMQRSRDFTDHRQSE